VLLFGPTSPARRGPPENPRHRVLWAGPSGEPHENLLAIGSDAVLDALAALPY
jgi:hypothetical protein